MTIEDAIKQCKGSGLKGWDLVAYAQKLISINMKYSYSNSFSMPQKAFEMGMGYCWQQAGALNIILNKLGFESRLVYAVKNFIPEKIFNGVLIKEHYSGHVWCRVRIDGIEKDVCPGNLDNKPGTIHFRSISKIKEWNSWISFWSYLGSAIVNLKRFKEFERLKNEDGKN